MKENNQNALETYLWYDISSLLFEYNNRNSLKQLQKTLDIKKLSM